MVLLFQPQALCCASLCHHDTLLLVWRTWLESSRKIAAAWGGSRGAHAFGEHFTCAYEMRSSWDIRCPRNREAELGGVAWFAPNRQDLFQHLKQRSSTLAAKQGAVARGPRSPSKDHCSSQMLESTQSEHPPQLLSYAVSFNITCYTEIELNYLQQVYLHF